MRRSTLPYAPLVLLVLCLVGALPMLGCSEQGATNAVAPSEDADLAEGSGAVIEAREGARIEILDGYAFWGHDEDLWVSALQRDGGLDPAERAGSFADDVCDLAALNGKLFVTTDEGLFSMSSRDDAEDALPLLEGESIDSFWATSEGIFCLDAGVLYRVPLEGGDSEELLDGVWDFVVARGGLYVLYEDGALARHDIGGGGGEIIDEARNRHDDSCLIAANDTVYLASSELLVLDESGDALADVGLEHRIEDPGDVVVYEDGVLYGADDGEHYRHLFEASDDGQEDERLDHGLFHGKPYGRVHDGLNYYIIGLEATVVDPDSLEWESPRVSDDADGPGEKDDGARFPSGSSGSSGTSSGTSSSAGYNIGEDMSLRLTDGTAVLSTAHFTLVLPRAQVEEGLWHIEQLNDTTIAFGYATAIEAGYGGRVFTLRAYDWGDNSYADIPASFVMGLSENKKYVGYLATDLQYDSGSSLQSEQYAELRSFAESLDTNSSSNGGSFTTNG